MYSIDSKFRQVMPENPLDAWELYVQCIREKEFFLAFLALLLLSAMQQYVYPVFNDAASAEAFM
jgi:hypothetical protein